MLHYRLSPGKSFFNSQTFHFASKLLAFHKKLSLNTYTYTIIAITNCRSCCPHFPHNFFILWFNYTNYAFQLRMELKHIIILFFISHLTVGSEFVCVWTRVFVGGLMYWGYLESVWFFKEIFCRLISWGWSGIEYCVELTLKKLVEAED